MLRTGPPWPTLPRGLSSLCEPYLLPQSGSQSGSAWRGSKGKLRSEVQSEPFIAAIRGRSLVAAYLLQELREHRRPCASTPCCAHSDIRGGAQYKALKCVAPRLAG